MLITHTLSKSDSISVIVVNWNAGRQLRECIDSIQKYGAPYVAQTIVVDNGSTDRSEKTVQNIPGVRVVLAGENLGFAKACNLGARYAQGDYLLFMNPDAALYKDTLSTALAFMERPENAKVGICGVQLVESDGAVARSCARFPTLARFVAQAIGLDRIFPSLGHFMREWEHNCTREVDQVIGAFFLVRRQLFEALGGFDERFFVYFEDLDFSFRARQSGWRSVYLAESRAFHAGGGTSKQIKARRLFYSLRSRLLYSFKHFSLLGAAVTMLATLFVEPVARSVLAVAKGSLSSLVETRQAYAMLWRWLLKLWRADGDRSKTP
jgi:GT2 family glycosyltransferase